MKNAVLTILIALSLQACATIQKPEIGNIPEQKPQISKVFEEPARKYLKRKVAIARFSNETKYGQGIFGQNSIGKQAMDILSAKLAATEKFILLERAEIQRVSDEAILGNIATMNIPADYLIIGSVSEFGRKETSDVGVFSRTKKQVAFAKVNVRLVDISTGQIVYSEEGSGEAFSEVGTVIGIGGRAAYDSTLNDKAISAGISKLINNIIQKLLDMPWRSFILLKEGDGYLIAGGKSQGLSINDTFKVVKKGKSIQNPQTGMKIVMPGEVVAKIMIRSLIDNPDPNSELALSVVVEGSIPDSGFKDLYIEEIL
jgi:curli biogenesis system outer membrane secretion channel CsgG